MKKTLVLAALVLAAIVATLSPSANAITGPNAVLSDRDNVVLLTFYDEQGVLLWRCSGTLIAPTIVLTAGHCTYQAAEARVRADQGPYVETPVDEGGYPLSPVEDRPPCAGYVGWPCEGEDATGEPLTYPASVSPESSRLRMPRSRTPATSALSSSTRRSSQTVASRRWLKRMRSMFSRLSVVARTSPSPMSATDFRRRVPRVTEFRMRIRLEVTTQLVNLRNSLTAGFNLQTSANPGGGRGGACFGDSGGPIFYDASNVIVAVTSFGITPWCTMTRVPHRPAGRARVDTRGRGRGGRNRPRRSSSLASEVPRGPALARRPSVIPRALAFYAACPQLSLSLLEPRDEMPATQIARTLPGLSRSPSIYVRRPLGFASFPARSG